MAQPLLRRLHEKLPGLELDVLAPEWVAPVTRRMPEVREVIGVPFRHGGLQLRSRWRVGRSLRGRGYQQAIVLPNTWKSALVPFFADIPVRSGYIGESRYGLLNLTYRKKDLPMNLDYARLAGPPGTEPTGELPRPRLEVSTAEISSVSANFGLPV